MLSLCSHKNLQAVVVSERGFDSFKPWLQTATLTTFIKICCLAYHCVTQFIWQCLGSA